MKLKKAEKLAYVSAPLRLDEKSGAPITSVEVLRVGTIQDRGLNISKGMLDDYVRNFKANVYGTELQINYEHNRGGEAAGWIKDLFIDGDSLMALVEWTEPATEKIRGKLYKFLSSELAPDYPRFDTGELVSNVFIGAGLTNTPALKGQSPLSLSEQEKLTHKSHAMFKELIKNLKKRAFLSAADVELARVALAEVADEEKAGAEKEVADLEKKQQDDAAAQAAKDAEDKKTKEAEALSEKSKSEFLSEFNALKESNRKLTETIALKELSDDVSKSLVLSETNKIGFLDEEVSNIVSFMQSLNDAQRTAFKALIPKVKAVEFKVLGSVEAGKVEHDQAEAVVALSEKIMKEGRAKTIDEAQKMAFAELKGKK